MSMGRLASLLLLLAATAQAQPFVSEEIIWRTMPAASPYIVTSRAAPVAADGDGFVVGWTEFDTQLRACLGRLDARGRLLDVGVRSPGVGDAAVIAPFGDRYVAAWLEPGNGPLPTLVTAAFDRDFRVVSTRPVAASPGAPILHVATPSAYVASGTILYEIDRDGAATKAYDALARIDDFTAVRDQVGYVTHSTKHMPSVCGFFQCSPPTDIYAVAFHWLNHQLGNWMWLFASTAPVSVAGDGGAFLLVFFDPSLGVRALAYRNTEVRQVALPGPLPRLDPTTQAQAVWDGARWVVVWPAGDGIAGAAITPDLAVRPFVVTARGARPSLAVSKPGRLLVTYEWSEDKTRRLASRVIDFDRPAQRERVVR